jgi:hypothetical protein
MSHCVLFTNIEAEHSQVPYCGTLFFCFMREFRLSPSYYRSFTVGLFKCPQILFFYLLPCHAFQFSTELSPFPRLQVPLRRGIAISSLSTSLETNLRTSLNNLAFEGGVHD